jgi:hypothetical protein
MEDYLYTIKYENIPIEMITYFSNILNSGYEYSDKTIRAMKRKEIVAFSKNKEDLEYIISANKYNI